MSRMRAQELAMMVRNFVFGVEDSVVSTVGLLSGIASAGVSTSTIFLTGTVLIFVEAFSMATGSFLSEESSEEIETSRKRLPKGSLIASLIMFFSYFLSGFVPLGPYMLFPREQAFFISILFSLVCLFILGVGSAKISKVSILRKGVEMALLGGIAILAGILVGKFIQGVQ